MQGAFGGGPLAEIAKRNMQMFEAATSAFKGAGGLMPGVPGVPGTTPAEADKDDEIAELKAQLAALNAKIDKLG